VLDFASKEVSGMKSINLLVDAGNANDASLIARSMLETMAALTWATQSPNERALLWRSHTTRRRVLPHASSGSSRQAG